MSHIKKIYLYAVSLISLVMLVIASTMLINLALKAWVFTKADQSYYYPVVNCAAFDETQPNISTYNDPACTDPNYKEKQAQAEKDNKAAQRQNDAAQAIALILVAGPVFYYHWKLARREA